MNTLRNSLTTSIVSSALEPQSSILSTRFNSPFTSTIDTALSTSRVSSAIDVQPIVSLYDRYGDSPGTAGNLGVISGTKKVNGWVGSSDTSDFYKINVFPTSMSGVSLNVVLRGLGADADLRVIRDDNSNGIVDYGEILGSSRNSGFSDESINLSFLAGGDYYIGVDRYLGDTQYQLLISDELPANILGSNILGIETELGILSATQVFSGNINNTNSVDTYHFTVNPEWFFDNINISLSGMTDNAYIRLIRDGNDNGIVDVGEDLNGSYSYGAEYASWNLGAGNYFLQVAQQTISVNTDYHVGISRGDWFSQNLRDREILGEARYAYFNDGSINRNEMIGLLRDAKDNMTIDFTELSDLRNIVANADGLGIADHVRVLTNKVVNGDIANPRAGIDNFGDLIARNDSTQMESLIGKWFLGSDRPIAVNLDTNPNLTKTFSYDYRYVSGSLFQNGMSYLDIDQGNCGDCYFLANLAAAALQSPMTIENMFIDNGDDTFTVRLFNNGVADYVTVDRFLPTNGGQAAYAGWGGGWNTSADNELWVALAEKAYAQFNQSGWIGQDGSNSYNGLMGRPDRDGINGGDSSIPLTQITGLTSESGWAARSVNNVPTDSRFLNQQITTMIDHFTNGDMVTIHTTAPQAASGIVGNHVYTLIGYDEVIDQFRVFNPWNYNDDTMAERWISRDQLMDNFNSWNAIA